MKLTKMNFQALWKRVQEWLQDQGQPRHYMRKEKRKLKSLKRKRRRDTSTKRHHPTKRKRTVNDEPETR